MYYSPSGGRKLHCLGPRGRGSIVVRLLTFHPGEPGSIPDGVALGFSHVVNVPDDAAGRRFFPGISRFPRPSIPAPLHTHLTSPSSSINTSMLRAAQISQLPLSAPACDVQWSGDRTQHREEKDFPLGIPPATGNVRQVSHMRDFVRRQAGSRALISVVGGGLRSCVSLSKKPASPWVRSHVFPHRAIATRSSRRWLCPAIDNRFPETASGTINKWWDNCKCKHTSCLTLVPQYSDALRTSCSKSGENRSLSQCVGDECVAQNSGIAIVRNATVGDRRQWRRTTTTINHVMPAPSTTPDPLPPSSHSLATIPPARSHALPRDRGGFRPRGVVPTTSILPPHFRQLRLADAGCPPHKQGCQLDTLPTITLESVGIAQNCKTQSHSIAKTPRILSPPKHESAGSALAMTINHNQIIRHTIDLSVSLSIHHSLSLFHLFARNCPLTPTTPIVPNPSLANRQIPVRPTLTVNQRPERTLSATSSKLLKVEAETARPYYELQKVLLWHNIVPILHRMSDEVNTYLLAASPGPAASNSGTTSLGSGSSRRRSPDEGLQFPGEAEAQTTLFDPAPRTRTQKVSTISAFTLSDLEKSLKTDIRMAGSGIELGSSRMRVQRVTAVPPRLTLEQVENAQKSRAADCATN
ncbi:hypothetical protein PR048_006740 [Dryococelus australis]|uniref:Uncharacterized protein n=1 Tax=Dryococelus australis TaxID=614101 RepID=A0ABQ9ID45_9NEOP|nr:hypothetical protein PR048_006740 [Dryococelus australis]